MFRDALVKLYYFVFLYDCRGDLRIYYTIVVYIHIRERYKTTDYFEKKNNIGDHTIYVSQ